MVGVPDLVSRILHQIRIGEKLHVAFPLFPPPIFPHTVPGKRKSLPASDGIGPATLSLLRSWVRGLLHYQVRWVGRVSVSGCG
jgi:hypothetical protein